MDGLYTYAFFAFLAQMADYLRRRPLPLGHLRTDKLAQVYRQISVILQSALPLIDFYLRLLTVVAASATVAR